jgi:hypothetical protein
MDTDSRYACKMRSFAAVNFFDRGRLARAAHWTEYVRLENRDPAKQGGAKPAVPSHG